MRELAGFALAMLAGYLVAANATAVDARTAATAAVAADNVTLRQTIKTLQQSCPTRPRLSRSPYQPGGAI